MENPSELHNEYYLQFATAESERFVLSNIGLDRLRTSKDKYFNDIIKHSNGGRGGWIWDETPMKMTLARELGESNCQSTRTCVGKAVATKLLAENPE